jgi:hypothetical protein
MASQLDDLIAQVQTTEGVLDSAVTFIQGVPALITSAVNAALANGATAAQLAPLGQLSTDLSAKTAALKAAIAANSPAPAPPQTPAP